MAIVDVSSGNVVLFNDLLAGAGLGEVAVLVELDLQGREPALLPPPEALMADGQMLGALVCLCEMLMLLLCMMVSRLTLTLRARQVKHPRRDRVWILVLAGMAGGGQQRFTCRDPDGSDSAPSNIIQHQTVW